MAGLTATILVAGCQTFPPGAERGPDGTMAYHVEITASDPGVRIEANGEHVGNTPMTLKIYGDTDGTFHDFGSYVYVIRALPLRTNEFTQVRVFRTGRMFTPQDLIPQQIYFDMTQPPPANPPVSYPPPAVYYYSPPYYYNYYWPPVYYYGPHYGGGIHVYRHRR